MQLKITSDQLVPREDVLPTEFEMLPVDAKLRLMDTMASWPKPHPQGKAKKKTRAGETLSPREIEVARLVADGHSNETIGIMLDISPSTAKFHLNNLMEKLGAENRAHVAAMAVRMGLA